jgi:protein phosphatase inhibitor 2
LTEQQKSSTMKITEPKTPYTRRYDPTKDSDDESDDAMQIDHEKPDGKVMARIDDIPGLDLGEPAEALPPASEEPERPVTRGRRDSTKQVVVEEAMPEKDPEPDGIYSSFCFGFWILDFVLICVEVERHRAFEALRKKHYEMKDAIKLGHQLEEQDEEEDEEEPKEGYRGRTLNEQVDDSPDSGCSAMVNGED